MQTLAIWLKLLLLDQISYREPFAAGRAAVNGLGHSLQTATRAERDSASREEIVMALVHDAARSLNDPKHAEVIADIMTGRLDENCVNALRYHNEFGADYVHGTSFSEQYCEEPWYKTTMRLRRWDLLAYDNHYPTFGLEHFLPLLKEICVA